VYDTLRVNLPKEIMAYSDYPFVKYNDDRRYPMHEDVRLYLQSFSKHFDIERQIEKNTFVESASPVPSSESESYKWKLSVREKGSQVCKDETFDALVVCNGHFEVPRFPSMGEGSGFDSGRFAGVQVHSRDYKRAEDEAYVGKNVLVVGTGPSGEDLSREVSQVANKVYWSGRGFSRAGEADLAKMKADRLKENIHVKSNTARVGESDGLVYFENESCEPVKVDTILWCTGYEYSVPFLQTGDEISTPKGLRIEPLYEHMFHPRFAQSLSFIGLGFHILPFPFFELQSKWMARCIAGTAPLPNRDEMLSEISSFYESIEGDSRGVGMTHDMDGIMFDYLGRIASKPGMKEEDAIANWKVNLYELNRKKKGKHQTSFRDVTLDEEIPFMEQSLNYTPEEMNAHRAQSQPLVAISPTTEQPEEALRL
jgi:hypothetical protein